MDNVITLAEFEFRKARRELTGEKYSLEDLASDVESGNYKPDPQRIATKIVPPEDPEAA